MDSKYLFLYIFILFHFFACQPKNENVYAIEHYSDAEVQVRIAKDLIIESLGRSIVQFENFYIPFAKTEQTISGFDSLKNNNDYIRFGQSALSAFYYYCHKNYDKADSLMQYIDIIEDSTYVRYCEILKMSIKNRVSPDSMSVLFFLESSKVTRKIIDYEKVEKFSLFSIGVWIEGNYLCINQIEQLDRSKNIRKIDYINPSPKEDLEMIIRLLAEIDRSAYLNKILSKTASLLVSYDELEIIEKIDYIEQSSVDKKIKEISEKIKDLRNFAMNND